MLICRSTSAANVKEEDVSSSDMDNLIKQEDTKPVSNLVKQQKTTQYDDYENDPEAGPSGLQTESARRRDNGRRMRYSDDSSDSDEGSISAWRTLRSYRPNQNDFEADTNNCSNNSWSLNASVTSEPSSLSQPTAVANEIPEVIDLSENESCHSNTGDQSPLATRSHEVLTAPDLQLDWLSDSSSDTEIVSIRSPDRIDALNLSKSNENALPSNNELFAIDLTASDDEENTASRNENRQSLHRAGATLIRRLRRRMEDSSR